MRQNPHSAKGETVFTDGEGANGPGADAARHVVRFRRAAVALSRDGERGDALEAASAILDLAALGEERILRGLLRPDPTADAVAWTVACYQIGDLTPRALRDFSDASAAVGTLAGCGEVQHVGAELVASTATGVTWTPLVRTGNEIAFRLFGAAVVWPGESDQGGVVSETERGARRGWEELLSGWELDPEAGVLPCPPGRIADTDLADRVTDLTARLATLEERIRVLEQGDRRGRLLPSDPGPSAAVGP